MSDQSEKPVYTKNYESVDHDYHRERHTLRNVLIILAVCIMALIAGGVYWWFFSRTPVSAPAQSPQTTEQQTTPSNTIAATTEKYTSKNFSLSFDHPEDWKIEDSTDSGKLTATSPVMVLVGADSQSVTGQIVLTFREPGQPLSEFDGGNALAVRDSEKLTYAQPSSGQRGSTYISFASSAGASNPTALEAVYVTGDFGYQNLQAIPAIDISKVNPVISITFRQCDKDCQTSSPALSVSNSMWDDPAFSAPLRKMLESLVVQ